MTRPVAADGLADALRAVVPARVARRLDGAPNPAAAWAWATEGDDVVVTTDGGERVRIAGPAPITADRLSCTCLLGPRCLHVLAVGVALPGAVAGPKRPAAAPGLVDALRAAAPARVTKKLDEGPNPADAWAWAPGDDGWTITTDAGDVVRLRGDPVAPDGVACTCLLGPRCLHVLAVAVALGGDAPIAALPEAAPPPEPTIALDGGQRAVVGATWTAAARALAAGASALGPAARQDLQRAVHGARAVGLHRLARAGARVLRHVADLDAERASFALPALADDLGELLTTAHALGAPAPTIGWVGAARRAYGPVGTLRLVGLCTEPVIAGTGQAGVVTHLCDAKGRGWSVADVLPGAPGRALGAYDGGAQIGGLSVPHRALGRTGLFAQNATASADRRLGGGGGVKATRAGASTWADEGPAALFATPLAAQVARALADEGLVFATGVVVGLYEGALVLHGAGIPLRVVAANPHPALRYAENLTLLGRAPGLALRVVARPAPDRPGELLGLAVGPAPAVSDDAPALTLPDDWAGRVNLGLDLLMSTHVRGLAAEPVALGGLPEAERADPLEPLRRRVRRMALGGRGTLPGEARDAVDREIAAYGRAMMPGAGRALAALADAAAASRGGDVDALARAWLSARVYTAAAGRAAAAAAWSG